MSKPHKKIIILDKLPEGWKYIKNATTAPKGYRWAYNGKSYFSGEREQAMIKDGGENRA